MKFFSGAFFLSFLFCPVLSWGEDSAAGNSNQCQGAAQNLEKQRTTAREEYNEECNSESGSKAKCIDLRQRIRDLDSQISNQKQKCQAQALEITNRKIKDANAKVKKHNKKTKTLGLISGTVGGVLLAKGLAQCGGFGSCNWKLIAMGLAGIGMGMHLANKGKELDSVVEGLTDNATTCEGEHCAPPPPAAPGGNPSAESLGTDLLAGTNTLPGELPFANCEPFCPCPGEPDKLPPNCKVTKDKDGNPKMTYGEDKDKDGFGDEEVTVADAKKVNQNDPGIRAAVAAAKAPYADMLAELEEEGDEELLAAAEDSGTAGEGFLSGGATAAGRKASSGSGSARRRHRGKGGDDVDKAVKGLMAQFLKKKKKKGAAKMESKLLGKSQIGVARDNIFLMVHRRYQERRGEREFFESRGGGSPLTHNISK